MEFYKILLEIMDEKHLTIPDVSRACGLTDSTVRSIIDRKQKKVALNVAFKLHSGLNVSLERLNGEQEKTAVQNKEARSNVLSPTEKEHIKKYRTLDGYGKEVVDLVLESECKRVQEQYQYAVARNGQREPIREVTDPDSLILPGEPADI